MRLSDKIRCAYYNLILFKSLKKRCYFGRGTKVEGRIHFSDRVFLDDNVEIRNRTSYDSYVGSRTSINRNTVVRGRFNIGSNCAIAPNCMIIGSSHVFANKDILINRQGSESDGITIEDDVWIGANVVVLDGITIGKGSVIGAGSVVTKSIPPYSIAVGNPCKVIKKR